MILLIGANGSIGRRYQAILKYLKQEFRVIEVGDPIQGGANDRAIIASPTDLHIEHMTLCSRMDIPFLCEKPLSKDPILLEKILPQLKNGFVVNNYTYIQSPYRPFSKIEYDFYNTGKDGLIWDTCQLIYLAHLDGAELHVKRESPRWTYKINGWSSDYELAEESYILMINDFIHDRHQNLWTLEDGLKMTQLCSQLEKQLGEDREDFNRNSSAFSFDPTARKDLREDRAEGTPSVGL